MPRNKRKKGSSKKTRSRLMCSTAEAWPNLSDLKTTMEEFQTRHGRMPTDMELIDLSNERTAAMSVPYPDEVEDVMMTVPEKATTSRMFMPKSKSIQSMCRHTGDKSVFQLEGIDFYALSGQYFNPSKYNAVLDLAHNLDMKTDTIKTNDAALIEVLNRYASNWDYGDCFVVQLNWADQAAPPVQPEFWPVLMKHFIQKKLDANLDIYRVGMACFGGHGRTGTALAAFLISHGWTKDKAVKTVRKNHCQKSVESAAQHQYLGSVSDIFPPNKTKESV